MIADTMRGRQAPDGGATASGLVAGSDREAGRTARWAGGALRRGLIAAWITLVGALAAPVASAAEFQTHRGDDLNIVVVTGEIMPDDDELFLAEVERATLDGEHALVVLASDGGALGAGMHMGLVIREAGLPTFVPEGERCASACALAWLAGEPRMTTQFSEIGFHQPYDDSTGQMVASIEANAVVGHYIATIGMGPEIVSFAVSAPPDGMAWLTPAIAGGIGLDVVEIVSDAPADDAMAMLTTRTPPVDESVTPVASVPAPIMRPLTATEVASLSLTGAIDGTGAVDGLPLVTAYVPVPGDDLSVGGPFEPMIDEAFAPMNEPTFDPAIELRTDVSIEPTGGFGHDDLLIGGDPIHDEMHDEMIGLPAMAADGTGMVNVETAVLDAVRAYGVGGPAALARDSATCWRNMRGAPSAASLQYCHVFDLVAAAVIDPTDPGEFAEFAVSVRLRAHREMVTGEVPAGYAETWRDDATMVVAAMGH